MLRLALSGEGGLGKAAAEQQPRQQEGGPQPGVEERNKPVRTKLDGGEKLSAPNTAHSAFMMTFNRWTVWPVFSSSRSMTAMPSWAAR